MTTIRTTCAECGDIELSTQDVGLELTAGEASGSYRFSCPTCGVVQRKPASHRVVSILLATGVSYEILPIFGEITEEEIAAFANALDQDGWYSELPLP